MRDAHDYNKEIENPDPRTVDWQRMLASIEAQHAKIAWLHANRVQVFAVLVSVIVSVVALWFAVAQMEQRLGLSPKAANESARTLIWLARHLYYNPLAGVAWTAIVVFTLFSFVSSGFRALRPFARLAISAKRLAYALGASLSTRIAKLFPTTADFGGALTGGTIVLAAGLVAIDAGQALLVSGGANGAFSESFIYKICKLVFGMIVDLLT